MSKYKVNDKYKVSGVTSDGSEPKLTKKYRRKSSTKDTLRSRSLSLGGLSSPQLSVVEIDASLSSPSPSPDKKMNMEFIPLPYSSKGNPFTNDNMYGYKVGLF